MPGNIDAVFAFAQSEIAHHVQTRLQGKDPTAVMDRGSEPAITVVASDKEVKAFSCDPSFDVRIRELLPGKRTFRFRLARAVYCKCVVRRSGTEQIALRAVADVFECAGINEQGVPF